MWLFILFLCLCKGKVSDELLNRNVTSDQILEKDENGNCFIPPFCNLDISKCNIPRVNVNDLSYKQFHEEYYIPQKPVIIQLCPDASNGCNLSQIIDNSTGIFEWHKIIERVRPKNEYEYLVKLEKNGTPKDRANTIDIHPLKDRDPATYKEIIDHILPLSVLDEIDMYNDLNGFLKTSDNPIMANKWVIFGTAGGGAHFHFDYYLSEFWNMAVSGRKYWVITEPYDTLAVWNNSNDDIKDVMNLSINDFFKDIYLSGYLEKEFRRINNGDYYYECIQNPGDIFYAPAIYYHATVNLEQTLSVSRNMITKRNYATTFNFITQLISLRSRNSDNELVGLYQTMDLCAALYHYDEDLFRNSACWTKDFLARLNSFNDEIANKTYQTDYFKYHKKYHSKLYIDSCNYAREHSQFSSFR
eukprot:300153_1